MTSISAVSQLVSVLQAQLAGRSRGAVRRGRAPQPGAAADAGQLGTLIAQRVAQIRADDPARGRKAFRIFLEAVLLAELDPALCADPGFHQLVDQVQTAMEEDPALAPLVRQAVGTLIDPQTPIHIKGK